MDNGFPDNNVVYAASADIAYEPGTHSPIPRRSRETKSFQRGFTRRSAAAATKQNVTKRFIDFVGSSVLIVALSPALACVSLMILRSGRNVIFKQQRIGKDGALFTCYKFRTMLPNAEQALAELLAGNPDLKVEWASCQKLRNDPRITGIGSFLRKTSLDELPQLFNVWKGDMSLVGPRPVVQNEIIRYGRAARWYFSARPGMTGLWQVSGRNDMDYKRRVALDSYYVRNQNFSLDFSILLRTVKVVLRGDGSY